MPFGPYHSALPVDGQGRRYVDAASWNAIVDNFKNWKENVNAGGYNVSNLNVLCFAAGGYINSRIGINGVADANLALSVWGGCFFHDSDGPVDLLFQAPGASLWWMSVNDVPGGNNFQLGTGASRPTSPLLALAGNSDCVGIGVAQPPQKLTVAGNIRMYGARRSLLFDGDGLDEQRCGLQFVGSQLGNFVVITPTDSDGAVRDNQTVRFGGGGSFNDATVHVNIPRGDLYLGTGRFTMGSGRLIQFLPTSAMDPGELADNHASLWSDEANNRLVFMCKNSGGVLKVAYINFA